MNSGQIVRRNIAHLGIILGNLGAVGTIMLIGSISGIFFILISYVFLLLIAILLVGIPLTIPGYRAFLKFDNYEPILNFLIASVPYVASITAILLVAAIVCMLMDPTWKKVKWRLILIGVVFVVFVIAVVVAIVKENVG